MVQESTHAFDSNLYENCPDNVDFLGYFQTHKYFEKFKMKSERTLLSLIIL